MSLYLTYVALVFDTLRELEPSTNRLWPFFTNKYNKVIRLLFESRGEGMAMWACKPKIQ
jgi:hypothetical protein